MKKPTIIIKKPNLPYVSYVFLLQGGVTIEHRSDVHLQISLQLIMENILKTSLSSFHTVES